MKMHKLCHSNESHQREHAQVFIIINSGSFTFGVKRSSLLGAGEKTRSIRIRSDGVKELDAAETGTQRCKSQ